MVAIPLAAHAQQYSGVINGTVVDQQNPAVGGATVTATNTGTNASYTATTSNLGAYTFAQLPVGTYEITVDQKGFKKSVTKAVEVHASTATELTVKLEVGAVSDGVFAATGRASLRGVSEIRA